jgi:16S rRNA (guanine527-N7)-methyltransferase
MSEDAGRAAFLAVHDVSRETLAKLDGYAALLTEWQAMMNLVGPATLPQLWTRHFADSAQLLPYAGPAKRWLDMGAGGGFPGVVLAIMDPEAHFTLVDSIAKKCRFLATVAETLGLANVQVENCRVEALPRQRFDVITARAMAALPQLLAWGHPFADAKTLWLLPKGMKAQEELASARQTFQFDHQLFPSQTDADARIIIARHVKPRKTRQR